MKVYGLTLGGLEVETGYWDFPINICHSTALHSGCLRCEEPESDDSDIIQPCNFGQDRVYDCRLSPFWPT